MFFFFFSVYFYFMPSLAPEKRMAVYGACAFLGLGGSTLLINSLAMISQMIGRNLVGLFLLFLCYQMAYGIKKRSSSNNFG